MDRKSNFENLWRDYADEENDYLIVSNEPLMNYLKTGGFFTAPASTKYHGVYEGGLYDHSKAVFLCLKWLTEKLNLHWQRPESPFIIGMFHDLCKCDQYEKAHVTKVLQEPDAPVDLGTEYVYSPNLILKGHGEKSIMILSQFMTLTEEEMLCIRYHMGAYEKEDWNEFDMAARKYETVLWTHQADQLASKIDGA